MNTLERIEKIKSHHIDFPPGMECDRCFLLKVLEKVREIAINRDHVKVSGGLGNPEQQEARWKKQRFDKELDEAMTKGSIKKVDTIEETKSQANIKAEHDLNYECSNLKCGCKDRYWI